MSELGKYNIAERRKYKACSNCHSESDCQLNLLYLNKKTPIIDNFLLNNLLKSVIVHFGKKEDDKIMILELYLNNNEITLSNTQLNYDLILHPKIFSYFNITNSSEIIQIEPITNYKALSSSFLIENNIIISIEFIENKSSTSWIEMNKFFEQVEISSKKSLFKKNKNLIEKLLKSKLKGKYLMNNQIIFIKIMGFICEIKINLINLNTNEFINDSYIILDDSMNIQLFNNKLLKKENKENNKLIKERTNNFIERIIKNEIGGIEEQLIEITKLLDITFYQSNTSHLPRTILIWGLQGNGKSSLLNIISEEYRDRGVIIRKTTGTSFDSEVFNLNSINNNCLLICVDDIDAMGNSLSNLLCQLQKVNSSDLKCMVLAVCNQNIEEMDESIRQSGHFERDIYIPIPSALETKKQVLDIHLKKQFIGLEDNVRNNLIESLVRFTSGFVGKDIQRLCRMAKYHHSCLSNGDMISWKDFEYALRVVKPSQLYTEKLFNVLKPNNQDKIREFEEMGGYEQIKKRCKELLYWPLEFPESFEKHGLPSCSGILLHGPSGCGKSLLVKSLAALGKMNYISIKCPEMFSKYIGETEMLIRHIFKRARQLAPCVLVFDEIDALAPRRELQENSSVTDSGSSARALSQLLNEMDGIQSRKQVFIIGCTNRINLIDQALLRPGRLDQIIKMEYPTQSDMLDILKVYKGRMPFSENIELAYLLSLIKDLKWTGADIYAWCREAALEVLREDINKSIIEIKHFESALNRLIR